MNKKAIIILSLCALFLFYKYIAQLFPSLIGMQLMHSYGYDGLMLAVMASSYYYSYTVMQVFSGLIIDRYAIRFPMFIAIMLISVMIFVYTHTNNFYLMCICRACMGIGASFATILYMKCAAQYTTPKTFGLISSFLGTATMLGAACGGTPVGFLFQKMGWKSGLDLIATAGLIMAFAVLIFQEDISEKPQTETGLKCSYFKTVFNKRDNWLLLLYSGLTFSPVAILGGLWGTPFLMTKFGTNAANASFFLSIMFVGHALGSPFWALVSAKVNKKKELMHFANVLAFLAVIGIIYGNFSSAVSLFLFFVFGFSVGCFMLSFEICRNINSLLVMGMAFAFINSGEGLVSAVIEPFIGFVLDTSKTGHDFTVANYHRALFVLPCCFILSSLILSYINREKTKAALTNSLIELSPELT